MMITFILVFVLGILAGAGMYHFFLGGKRFTYHFSLCTDACGKLTAVPVEECDNNCAEVEEVLGRSAFKKAVLNLRREIQNSMRRKAKERNISARERCWGLFIRSQLISVLDSMLDGKSKGNPAGVIEQGREQCEKEV